MTKLTGQCGYPGQPLNGTTYLRVNSQRMNQKKLQNAFNEAVYFCDDNHLLTENTKKLRVCENGMWNGELPQCG